MGGFKKKCIEFFIIGLDPATHLLNIFKLWSRNASNHLREEATITSAEIAATPANPSKGVVLA